MTKTKTVVKLGFWSIVLLTINSIIGSGIFLSPGAVVVQSGTAAPVIYLLAALFASVLAITFAMAAKYVVKSGAAYAYAKAAFGENVGFYVGITRFISASIAWGVMATGVVRTVLSIMGLDNTDFTYTTIGFILLMAIILIINLFGTRVFEFISNLSTIGKLLALVTMIGTGIIVVLTTGTNHFSEINQMKDAAGQFIVQPRTLSTYVMAVVAAFYAFTGFESIASGAEDMENPQKNLPIAIPFAVLIIAIIYIAIILTSMMINPQALMDPKQIISLVGIFQNKIIQNIILYGALVSMFGINVASSFHAPRILEAMAKEDQIPPTLAKRTKKDFPLRTSLITIILAILVPMTFKYNMASLIILSAIARFLQFVVVPIGVIKFFYGKNVEEILPNPHKNFFTDVVIPVIALILTVFLLAKFDWAKQFMIVDETGTKTLNIYAIIMMVLGYFVLPAVIMGMNKSRQKKNKKY